MNKNSNLVVAVVVVVSFIFLWNSYLSRHYGPPKSSTATRPSSTTNSENSTKSSGSRPANSEQINVISTPQSSIRTDVELNVKDIRVKVDSVGSRVSSWKINERAYQLELIHHDKNTKKFPLELYPDLNYAVVKQTTNSIMLEAKHPAGFIIQKSLELNQSDALQHVTLIFKNPTNQTVSVDSSFGWAEGLAKHRMDRDSGAPQADAIVQEMRALGFRGQLQKWKSGVIFGRTIDQPNKGPYEWFGVANNHFIAVLIPVGQPAESIDVFADRKTPPSVTMPLQFQLLPGASKELKFDLYVGPKKIELLKSLGYNLNEAVEFGTFSFISRPLLTALEFFRKSTGNYGWAIIILTICIQIVVFPLTKKSLDHSVKMKELQPQLKLLQEQFKKDPKRFQVEQLNLFKKHGMHFMGLEGCFPILLQIPVFFAFYAALNGAYELRGAPWIGWVSDLAAPDPFYVLPLLMGAGMFVQQKLTTVATDPAQARMMMFMPVFMIFIFLKMPAGLVLYWTVNNICTIVSQRILVLRRTSVPVQTTP